MLNKPSRKQRPALAREWDEYGHEIAWDDLIDIKVGSHGYVALAWWVDEKARVVDYADLATGDKGATWEMQNDGHGEMPLARWEKARVKSECDWLEFRRKDGSWTSNADSEDLA